MSDKELKNRRNLLKGAAVAGGLGAFAAGYSNTAKNMVNGVLKGSAGDATDDRITGKALQVEGQVVDGQWVLNPKQTISNTQCFGCWTVCGLRVRVDKESNKVIRLAGNPYHPLSHEQHFPYDASIAQAMSRLGGDGGINDRSTACARGAAMAEGIDSPYRVTQPLKRVGKRGEGKWESISFEQLVAEVINGGDLFGEGHVDGLRAIRDIETPIDPSIPELGVKANQLMVTNAGNEGRENFVQRFANKAFGTKNFYGHGSYCGLTYRLGSGAVMNDMDKNAHAKPDLEHSEFVIFMGMNSAQAGNPFKRQGRQLATARAKEQPFKYVTVAPNIPLTNTLAHKDNHWIPILPGTDSAMAMGMIRWIIEQERYNLGYLQTAGKLGQTTRGEVSCCNASHLVISSESHPLYGRFLRQTDLTGSVEGTSRDESNLVAIEASTNELRDVDQVTTGELYITREITLHSGEQVEVKSSFQLLKESAFKMSMEEYSQECDVPVAHITRLAQEFTNHGRKAAIITHGGAMSGNGFYNAWCIMTLNVLIGNMNQKGGMLVNGGAYASYAKGPRYDLAGFKGAFQPKGMLITRGKKPYPTSTEFKNKVAQGKAPFPAEEPWYPFAGGQMTEALISSLAHKPYGIKAWISHMTNPVYGIAGMRSLLLDQLKDPKVLPLFIAVDAYINETTALADYIVPDTHNYESWGFTSAWAGVPFKSSTARWPVVKPTHAKTAEGEPVGMESFFIALAKELKLAGFGEGAITDNDGNSYPLNRAEDFYLRAAANMAYDGVPVPQATDEDMAITGVDRLKEELEQTLKLDEVAQVAYVYARGGRFAPYETGWSGEHLNKKWTAIMQFWSERVAPHKHALNGERYSGCPTYYPAKFANGTAMREHFSEEQWPLLVMSYKSHLASSGAGYLEKVSYIQPQNIVALHPDSAAKYGVRSGDEVYIETPSAKVKAQIKVLMGVMQGVIAIEHGYGHKELGAGQHVIDGKPMAVSKVLGAGVNQNDLAVQDPTRTIPAPWLDWVTGAAVRQGLPARIIKI